MPRIIHESIEAFKASRDPAFKGARPSDPLAKYFVLGDWWNGRVLEDTDPPAVLPEIVSIASEPDARQAARKGWRPFYDTVGQVAVPDDVVALLAGFYKGKEKDTPPRITALLLKATAPAALAKK